MEHAKAMKEWKSIYFTYTSMHHIHTLVIDAKRFHRLGTIDGESGTSLNINCHLQLKNNPSLRMKTLTFRFIAKRILKK